MYLSPRGSQVTAPHQATPQMNLVEIIGTPSDSLLEVVLDKVWVKHWKYKSWITFKSVSLEMW
jgi:hypothetical protein